MATINTNEKAFLETVDLGIQMGCDNEEFSVNPIAWKDSASDEDETYFYAVGWLQVRLQLQTHLTA